MKPKKARPTKYDQVLTPGTKLGQWEVLHPPYRDRHGRAVVLCRCSCGKEQDVYAYPLVKGKTNQCKSCSSGKTLTIGGLSGQTQRSAIGYGLNYSLSPTLLSQSLSLQANTCAISGEPISPTSAMVARVDHTKGFTPSNSVLVSKKYEPLLAQADVNLLMDAVLSYAAHQPTRMTVQDFLNKREIQ